MKKFTNVTRMLATISFFLIPTAILAQETKKEIHLKIVENGVVKKDTIYTLTGPASMDDHFEIIEKHRSQDENMNMKQKQVFIMRDSMDQEFEWIEQDTQNKEVKVIMRKGHGPGENREVEEIWIEKANEGMPCRTIIIHEGDCPGSETHKIFITDGPDGARHVSPDPPAPPKAGKKPVKVEKSVIKTEDGEKVIIIETVVEEKGKKKN